MIKISVIMICFASDFNWLFYYSNTNVYCTWLDAVVCYGMKLLVSYSK